MQKQELSNVQCANVGEFLMKKEFIWFRDIFTTLKMYLRRTMSYISLINTAMIMFLFISNLEKYNIDIDLKTWLVPLLVISFVGVFLFGYLEDKLGFYKEEMRYGQSRSPYFKHIITELKKINARIDKIEEYVIQ
jgi:hypothetical protein